jgi:hypothetical protein
VDGLDRIKPPEQRMLERPVASHPDGKAALFSATAPAPPLGALGGLRCARCGAHSAMDTRLALRLLRRGTVVLPGRGLSLYGPCPACRTRSRLHLVPPP